MEPIGPGHDAEPPAAAGAPWHRALRVLLTTEGTYPFIHGGVSTWCDVLVNGLTDVRWQVLPITAGGVRRSALYDIGPNVEVVSHLELWSESVHPWNPLRRSADLDDLPARS